jgi:multiple sugar transport system substrate-binding protein
MRKVHREIVVLLLLSVLIISGVSAQAAEPITIQFWNAFTGSDGDILREIVNRFNKENQYGITIEMDIMPGTTLTQKLAPAIATNTAPALVLAGSLDVPMYAKNGNMIPMDDFFEKTDANRDDFVEAALESLQYEGSQIMIPMQWFTTYLYYNKDLFEAAGLDPETPPTIWEEVAEYAAKITDPNRNIYGIGFCISGGVSWFNSLFMSNGGQIIDTENKKSLLVSQENIESLKYIQEIVKAGYSPKGMTGADLDNLMYAGRIGMLINGPWMVAGLRENEINFGVTGMPAGKAGRVGIAETTGFCIPKGTSAEARAAAYKFIEYWNTTEICKEWSMRNGFPPYLKSVISDEEVKNNEIISAFSQITEYGVPFGSGLTTTSQIINDILFPMIENIIAGGDPEEELNKASRAIDEVLATE